MKLTWMEEWIIFLIYSVTLYLAENTAVTLKKHWAVISIGDCCECLALTVQTLCTMIQRCRERNIWLYAKYKINEGWKHNKKCKV